MSDDFVSLPDDLMAARAAMDIGTYWDPAVIDRAHDRICELEEQAMRDRHAVASLTEHVKTLRQAIAGHRGHRDFHGGKISADLTLWELVADVPWHGERIKGDG